MNVEPLKSRSMGLYATCLLMGKSLSLPGPQFPHLKISWIGTSLAVDFASSAEGVGSILDWRAKIPHASWPK